MQQGRGGMGSHKRGLATPGAAARAEAVPEEFFNAEAERRTRRAAIRVHRSGRALESPSRQKR
jgi:hypothetical protein